MTRPFRTSITLPADPTLDLEAATKQYVDASDAEDCLGEILISDTPSTPLVFADLLQNEAEDDLLYADC